MTMAECFIHSNGRFFIPGGGPTVTDCRVYASAMACGSGPPIWLNTRRSIVLEVCIV